jgi:acyl-CoA ligase (AMP-forming) (exosortase A-associated)
MKAFLVQHFLEEACRRHPDKTAIKQGSSSITFEQLYAKATAMGLGLQKAKFQRGERVGIILDKSIEQVICLLGVLYADYVFVLIAPILHQRQIHHILKDCGIRILISSKKYQSKFQNIVDKTDVETVLLEDDLQEAFTNNRGGVPQNKNVGEDISNIIYTSGSTGLPKGIAISHRNLIEGAKIVSGYLEITAEEIILGLPPLNFDYGLNQLISTLYTGCTLVLFQFFMPNSLLKILIDENITGLPSLPSIWAAVFNPAMCRIDPKQRYDGLRYISNTGGKLPAAMVKNIRRLFPHTKLYLMYGLTEAFRSTYLDPAEVDKRPDSIGKAIPNVRVEVIDENGDICKPGQVGELIHSGACITKGYWNNPALTAKVFKANPFYPRSNQFLDRVVYSGDLVKKDDQGFLYYVGRKDAMIKKGGYRVSPTEVEDLLTNHDDVFEAVVYGAETDSGDNEIIALVHSKGQMPIEELIKFCRQKAPEYLVPDKIQSVDHFDRTETGKIDRQKALKEFTKKSYER